MEMYIRRVILLGQMVMRVTIDTEVETQVAFEQCSEKSILDDPNPEIKTQESTKSRPRNSS